MIMTPPVVDLALTIQFIADYPVDLQKKLHYHALPVPRSSLIHGYLLTGDANVGKSRFGAILADIHKCPLLWIKVPSLERASILREFNLLLDPIIESNHPWIILCSRMDSRCEDAAEAGREASRALEFMFDKIDMRGGQGNTNLIIVATATSHMNITDALKRRMISGCFTIQRQNRASLHDKALSPNVKDFFVGCAGGAVVGALLVGAYFGFRTYKPYFEGK